MGGIFDAYQRGNQAFQQNQDRERQQTARQGLSTYLQTGDKAALAPSYDNDPTGTAAAVEQVSGQKRDALVQRAKYLLAMPEQARAAAWPSVKASMQSVDSEIFAALPDAYDPVTFGPVLQQIAQQGNVGTGVQSTYLDDQGQRVAVMRDGSLKVLGGADLGMSNQTISIAGPDGRPRQYTFNKRTGGYEPAGSGEAPQQPQQAPAPTLAGSGGDPQMDALSQAANAMIKAGIPPEQVDAFLMQAAQASPNVQVNPPQQTPVSNPQPAPMPAPANAVGGGPIAPLPGSGRSPFVGRSPEEQAAATKGAEIETTLSYADRVAEAEAKAARLKKEAEAAGERTAQAPKRVAAYKQALASSASVVDAITRAKGLIGPYSTGYVGARLRDKEGTPAYDLAATVETIKANLGFDRLQQMRDNSPTGGALGAIAVQELVALQSTIANLDPNQSEPQIRAALEKVEGHYQAWMESVNKAIAEEESGGQSAAGSAKKIQFDAQGNRI